MFSGSLKLQHFVFTSKKNPIAQNPKFITIIIIIFLLIQIKVVTSFH